MKRPIYTYERQGDGSYRKRLRNGDTTAGRYQFNAGNRTMTLIKQ